MRIQTFLLLSISVITLNCTSLQKGSSISKVELPFNYKGQFLDDYGILYSISDTLFFQHPNSKYHILSYNAKENYLIAKNDSNNPTDGDLYTRIDFTNFQHMQDFHWGFCFTVYNATDIQNLKNRKEADRENPKKGCNGYPFTRMKKN